MFPLKKKQALYSCEAVEKLISQYYERGGELHTIEEGSLGYGLTILTGAGLKTAIITEVYINCWTSGHKIRMYNETPKKYQEMIDALA